MAETFHHADALAIGFEFPAAKPPQAPQVGDYVIARNVRGIYSSTGQPAETLRCRLYRLDGGCAFVVTADLADAGTDLILPVEQVEFLEAGEGRP